MEVRRKSIEQPGAFARNRRTHVAGAYNARVHTGARCARKLKIVFLELQ